MEDSVKSILAESNTIISKLQLLTFFFEDEIIYKIYIRSQVIHRLFESNPELDINKLDLFHLQFTESIIELLRRIKKVNEKNVSVLFDEVHLNEELIAKISESMHAHKVFDSDAQKQAVIINQSLNRLYKNLSNHSSEYPFLKNINDFNTRYAQDFFNPLSDSFLYDLLEYNPDLVYKNGYATIEKKLLGLQCKHGFRNTFYCGLKSENFIIEVYKVVDADEYFLFYASGNLFLDCPFSSLSGIVLPDTLSKKVKIIRELTDKNDRLKSNEKSVKKNIPIEVAKLLSEYYEKISAIDFIDFIDDYDIQANILKTMLNTDSM